MQWTFIKEEQGSWGRRVKVFHAEREDGLFFVLKQPPGSAMKTVTVRRGGPDGTPITELTAWKIADAKWGAENFDFAKWKAEEIERLTRAIDRARDRLADQEVELARIKAL